MNNLLFSSRCTLERGAGTVHTWQSKSPWESDAVFMFFCNFLMPYKKVHPFQIFSAAFSLPNLYNIETRKNSGYTRPTLFVWGTGGEGLGEGGL